MPVLRRQGVKGFYGILREFCVYMRWPSPQDTRPQCNSPPRKGLLPLQTADTPHERTFEESALLVYSSHAFVSSTMQRPDAGPQALRV